jgi:hypothetical protein
VSIAYDSYRAEIMSPSPVAVDDPDRPSSIIDIISTRNYDLLPDDNDDDEQGGGVLRRVDQRPGRYTPLPFSSPVKWRQSAAHLQPPQADLRPAIAIVMTMYNEDRYDRDCRTKKCDVFSYLLFCHFLGIFLQSGIAKTKFKCANVNPKFCMTAQMF